MSWLTPHHKRDLVDKDPPEDFKCEGCGGYHDYETLTEYLICFDQSGQPPDEIRWLCSECASAYVYRSTFITPRCRPQRRKNGVS